MDSQEADMPIWLDAFLEGATGAPPAANANPRLALLHTDDLAGAQRLAAAHPGRQLAPQASGGVVVAEVASGPEDQDSAFERLLSDAKALRGRTVCVLAPGAIGQASLLGRAPQALSDACQQLPKAPGLYVDTATLRLLSVAPEAKVTGGARLTTARRRWPVGALVAAAAVAAAAALFMWVAPAPEAAPVSIFVNISEETKRGTTGRQGDEVVVSVTGPKQHYVTLLLLDSKDEIVIPGLDRNRRLSSHGQTTFLMTFDNQPGLERFIAVVTPEPLKPIDDLVNRLNTDTQGREARFETLKKRLSGAGAIIQSAYDVRHKP